MEIYGESGLVKVICSQLEGSWFKPPLRDVQTFLVYFLLGLWEKGDAISKVALARTFSVGLKKMLIVFPLSPLH